MQWNLIDVGSIAVTIAIVEFLKPLVAERYVPLLPFAIGYLVAFVVVNNTGCFVTDAGFWPKFINEGLKIALASMSAYKLYKTTIKGDNVDETLDFSLDESSDEEGEGEGDNG